MNGVVAYGRPVTIVLDDLHAVRSEASLGSIAHAIERLPPEARVVVSTRSDPAVGLAKLRAKRALIEVRARELAFTVDEARELFVREGIELSGDSVGLLVERTEGWPAGLYLAALWLRDLDDPDEGVRAFAGSARHVGDYLTAEVLAALPAETRDFLVQTSVLGRFTPELCDAVLGREDSAALLAELAHSNMFLVALDACAEWHRYHHLFGELLQLELGRDAARELRRRAADWCRAHGLVEEAIEHASAAGDAETMAELLLETHLEFIRGGRAGQFLGWIRRLPAELLVEHPLLPAAGAAAAGLLARPEVEIQRLLAVSERARRGHPHAWSPYVEAVVELTRAEVIERGDVAAAAEHARRAVAAARAGADVLSVGALATLSQALFFAGDLDESRRIAVQAIERPDAPDVPDGYVGSLGLLALIDAEQGRNDSAERSAREALSFAREHFQSKSWVASLAHLGLALACAATGRLDEAEREALRGERLRRSTHPTVGHAHALLVLAQVRVARVTLGACRQRTQTRARDDRGVSRSGAAAGDRIHRRAGPHHGRSECRKRTRRRGPQRGRGCRAALPRCRALAARDRRATLHLAEHSQDPHAGAVPQAGRDIGSGGGRPRRNARSARADRITRVIPGRDRPKRGHRRAWCGLACQRIATASSSRESSVRVTHPPLTE